MSDSKAAPPPGARLAAAALFAAVFALALFPIRDPDAWWHLKTGELIWTTRSIPTRDVYSYVIQGKPWVTFEWLSQVAFYLVYRAAGAAGLISLKALLAAAAFALSFALGGGSPASAPLFTLAALLSRGFFSERPQLFDYVLVPVFARAVEGEPEAALFWRLPALVALWANLHGGAALLGAGVVGLRAVQSALRGGERLERWLLLTGLCAAAVLANAHGAAVLRQLYETVTFPGKEMINEWRPPAPSRAGTARAWRRRPRRWRSGTAKSPSSRC